MMVAALVKSGGKNKLIIEGMFVEVLIETNK